MRADARPDWIGPLHLTRPDGRFRRSPRATAFLRDATAAALGLMAAVTLELGRIAVTDVVVAYALARRYELSAIWRSSGERWSVWSSG